MNMKRVGRWTAVAAAVLLGAPLAGAQPAPPAPPAADDASRVEAEARLREAEQRLQEAAREIAALTSQVIGESGVAIARELAGRARRVMLGINIGAVGGPETREDGVQVLGVTPGSPADQAGLRSGDVLVSVAGKSLDWSGDTAPVEKLLDALREIEPGTKVELGYRRDGEIAQVAVEARSWSRALFIDKDLRGFLPPDAPLPPGFGWRSGSSSWGDMELVTLTAGLGDYFKVKEGVLVVRAPADPTLGLQDGDVIVDIAGRQPADPGHVVRILRSYAPGERLVMTVVRQGQRRQLEADIPG